MDNVSLPAGLQTLTFSSRFNQSMDKVSLPAGLLTLTFGLQFNQSMDKVSLPAGLQTLTFGGRFNQKAWTKPSLLAGESTSWPPDAHFWN
eukprot:TRINITY_DN11195_c0_g1_i5.p1 TRINITY_DN11195_c0_g1~~TRINITY_DN11195_c0_g1_i5.p1  ORF type:complete len:102 (+),score=15.92 TRINITY_DN11195_c0_g1_i5:39-308(+)